MSLDSPIFFKKSRVLSRSIDDLDRIWRKMKNHGGNLVIAVSDRGHWHRMDRAGSSRGEVDARAARSRDDGPRAEAGALGANDATAGGARPVPGPGLCPKGARAAGTGSDDRRRRAPGQVGRPGPGRPPRVDRHPTADDGR